MYLEVEQIELEVLEEILGTEFDMQIDSFENLDLERAKYLLYVAELLLRIREKLESSQN